MKGRSMLGTFLLWFSLGTAWIAVFFCFRKTKNEKSSIFIFVLLTALLVFVSYGMYMNAFLQHQFQFYNVWSHSNRSMNTLQLIACSWSGQSGSLFLWLIFTQITLFIGLKDRLLRNQVVFFLLLLHSLILLLLLQSNPFLVHSSPFTDGLGMNPVLSHPLMVTHPPFAFLSYAFLGLYFSASMGALLKKTDFEWIKRYHYTLYIALFGMTVTMILGSLWAYEITGWGGYWSFDPVESGSLSLWFAILFLLHIYPLYIKHHFGKIWFYVVPIFFTFSIFYVSFLIRSGLLESFTAHTYAQGGLVVVLYGIIFLLLVLPGVFLWSKYPQLTRSKNEQKELQKPLVTERILHYCFGVFACILFVQVTLPVFTDKIFLSATLIQIFMILFLFFISTYLIRLFLRKKSLSFFLQVQASTLIVYMYIVAIYPQLRDVQYPPLHYFSIYIGFLWSFFWIFSSLKTISWKKIGSMFVHCAVGFILVGVFINTPLNTQETVFLSPNKTKTAGNYQFVEKVEKHQSSMYIGQKRTMHLLCETFLGKTVHLWPAIWSYTRNFTNYTLPIPAMMFQLKEDLQVIPHGEVGILAQLHDTIEREGISFHLIRFESSPLENGFTLERATIELKSHLDLLPEEIRLQRLLHPNGKQLNNASAFSTTLQDYLHWVDTVGENAIVLDTEKFIDQTKYEIQFKPGMFWIRTAYWLLMIGCLFFLFSLLKRVFKKSRKTRTIME